VFLHCDEAAVCLFVIAFVRKYSNMPNKRLAQTQATKDATKMKNAIKGRWEGYPSVALYLGAKEWMNVYPSTHQLLVRQVDIQIAGSPHPRLLQRGARKRYSSRRRMEGF
jgi:molybdenum cofactor biosynthesis enzyme